MTADELQKQRIKLWIKVYVTYINPELRYLANNAKERAKIADLSLEQFDKRFKIS